MRERNSVDSSSIFYSVVALSLREPLISPPVRYRYNGPSLRFAVLIFFRVQLISRGTPVRANWKPVALLFESVIDIIAFFPFLELI